MKTKNESINLLTSETTAVSKPFLTLTCCLGALLAASSAAVAGPVPLPPVTPVATGLNNPRGLTVGPDGSLYVAEAGLGAGDDNGGFAVGVGFTGSITEIRKVRSSHPTVHRVVTGLASVGDTANGFNEVVGPDGVSYQREEGLYIIMAESVSGVLDGDPSLDPDIVGQFGHLLRLRRHEPWEGHKDTGPDYPWTAIADVGDFNYGWTGAHKADPWASADQFPDANPYAVLALRDHQYVVDAGANTLNEVRPDGTVRIVTYVPNPIVGGQPISDAVPTCLAKGPDGAIYVGTLAFSANAVSGGGGQSVVYRVDLASPTTPVVWADGLNPITGCGFGKDNAFYVTEFTTLFPASDLGDVVRIALNPDGSAGTRTILGAGALHSPNGFACDSDGSIYVSNYSTSTAVDPTPGEVVRVNN